MGLNYIEEGEVLEEVYYYRGDDGSLSLWCKTQSNYFTTDEINLIHSFNDEAAEIWYGDKGKTSEEWRNHGHLHRLGNKPALIMYQKNNIKYEEYWINGKQVTLEESIIYNNRLEMLGEL